VTRVTTISTSPQVLASVLINGQLFVTPFGTGRVDVYDTTSLQLLRSIPIAGLSCCPFGIAVDATKNILYISERYSNKVNSVDLTTNSVVTWNNIPGPVGGLSMTSAGNVLVAFSNGVNEYTSSGSFVRGITDSNRPFHAVEVNNGTWVFSRQTLVNGIAMISTNGTVLKTFGSTAGSGLTQMNAPRGIAIDPNGNILVADCYNSRILVLDPTLTIARQLLLPVNTPLNPNFITIDREHGRMYVGEDIGQQRLLAFDIN